MKKSGRTSPQHPEKLAGVRGPFPLDHLALGGILLMVALPLFTCRHRGRIRTDGAAAALLQPRESFCTKSMCQSHLG